MALVEFLVQLGQNFIQGLRKSCMENPNELQVYSLQ